MLRIVFRERESSENSPRKPVDIKFFYIVFSDILRFFFFLIINFLTEIHDFHSICVTTAVWGIIIYVDA